MQTVNNYSADIYLIKEFVHMNNVICMQAVVFSNNQSGKSCGAVFVLCC